MKKECAKRTLISCLLAIMLCSTILVEVTYSWFTSSVSNLENRVETATYKVSVAQDEQEVTGDYTFLTAGSISFSLTANGTASKGYCVVYIVENGTETKYHTDSIVPDAGAQYVITIKAEAGTVVRFNAGWGIADSEITTIANGGLVDLTAIEEPAAQ